MPYFLRTFAFIMLYSNFTQSVSAESEYEAWLNQNRFDAQASQQEFQDYLDANDKEFIGFLKQQWKKVELEKPKVLDDTPKPVQLPKAPITVIPPVIKPSDPEVPAPKQPIVQIRPIKADPIIKPPVLPITPKPPHRTVSLDFYGHKVSLPKVKPMQFKQRLGSKNIAQHWKNMASEKHNHIIKDLKSYQKTLNLNDWAMALLVFEYSQAIGLNEINSQQLFTWFLLVKSGYDVRLAYNDQAFILMPTQQALYGVTYFTLKGKKYYAASLDGKKVNTGRAYTYSGNHESANKLVDFDGSSEFLPSKHSQRKKLKFKFEGQVHTINVTYDLGMVKFSNTVPQLSIQYYPKQGLPNATSQQLLQQLQQKIKGKTELDAVNLLLRFTQTAFAYKTDDQQFQKENYLLPLETLHYPYSDCEDRASLFSWLVENLLGLDAVLLDYPGHIAAAVKFSNTPAGDNVPYKGLSYTVTDPTYINASAGMTMPQFKNIKPKVVNF